MSISPLTRLSVGRCFFADHPAAKLCDEHFAVASAGLLADRHPLMLPHDGGVVEC
jgi:hypothetical protein